MQWLVVGLGNPGTEYAGSPHNVGFDVVQRLADERRIPFVAKHDGLLGVGSVGDVDVALLMPMTFMNLSGRSVRPALKALGLTPQQLLVVHDEIDLDFGVVQLKHGGGLAGHNGLKSIAELLGTRDFTRVRMGVGRPDPGDRRPIADWILRPIPSDRDADGLRHDAEAAVVEVLTRGVRGAMKHVNTRTPD